MFKDVIQLIGITHTHIPYLFCALQGIPDFIHFTLCQSNKVPMLIKQGLAFVFQFVIRKKTNCFEANNFGELWRSGKLLGNLKSFSSSLTDVNGTEKYVSRVGSNRIESRLDPPIVALASR